MTEMNLPDQVDDRHAWETDSPDPGLYPHYYAGLAWRRVFAWFLDFVFQMALVGALFTIAYFVNLVTLGLLSLLLAPIFIFGYVGVRTLYLTLLIGGNQSATIGMKLLRLEVRTINGDKPSMTLAFIRAFMFQVVEPFFILTLMGLVNPRGRLIHDYLSQTVVLRTVPWRPIDPS